ncbi:hypothetical protein [uncultured Sphingomonas sp.]|uniref:hypothetical protein n=1 Tax=uncultured Sphingomonas sp. TaxID=158754 RepID=UPI0035CA0CEB
MIRDDCAGRNRNCAQQYCACEQQSPIRSGPAIQPARRPTMRVMETLTGTVLAVATIVLAVETILVF